MSRSSLRPFVASIVAPTLAAFVFALPARSQCLTWSAPYAPNGEVNALLVFDDGTGPALYAGGYFTTIGGHSASYIAKWNGHVWSALGSGVNLPVLALASFDDGTGPALYAGGMFTAAGGAPASYIAKWKGGVWSPLGVGVNDRVHAMTVFDDGTGPALYVGGDFFNAGGSPALGVARWTGASWSSVGTQYLVSTYALTAYQVGGQRALYAGGGFNVGHESPGGNIAVWNGSTWTQVGGGVGGQHVEQFVYSMVVFDDGTGPALYVGGTFASAGGNPFNNIVRWDGANWSGLGLGLRGHWAGVTALCAFDDGAGPALYAGGLFSRAGTGTANQIARWNGNDWSPLRHGVDNTVWALAAYDGGAGGVPNLFVGGTFTETDEEYVGRLAIWRGCQGPGTMMCFGDGSAAACPCSNSGLAEHGCENSSATGGALLSSSGYAVPDSVLLHASSEPASAFTIFLQGDASLAVPHLFGDGLLCAGGHLLRLYEAHASSGTCIVPHQGDPSVSARSAALGDPLVPGSVRYYQSYYRDPSATFCAPPAGASFNASNALRIVW